MRSPSVTPPPAQGASCATGGILRGRAYGNAMNHADFTDARSDTFLGYVPTSKGQVQVYTDSNQTKPAMTFKHAVSSSLGPVLKTLARRYSDASKSNHRIFILEDDIWDVKGRFEDALEDDEDATWSLKDGKKILEILVVS